MDTRTYITTLESHSAVILLSLLLLVGTLAVVYLLVVILNRHWLRRRTMTWLEITPPASIAKTPEATEHLFTVIHGNSAARSPKDKLLGRLPVMSFEIVSTKKEGIRYLMQVEVSRSSSLQKTIVAYLPDSKVRVIDPLSQNNKTVVEFKQTKHYVLPIKTILPIEQHDPLSYITGAMTKLDEGEMITMQIILTPLNLPEARRLAKRFLSNEDILRRVQQGKLSFISKLFEGLSSVAAGVAELTGEFYSGTTYGHRQNKSFNKDAQYQSQVMKGQRPARTLSTFELELMESMHQKLTKPLFSVNLRIMVAGNSSKEHVASLRTALDAYSVPPYQELRPKIWLPFTTRYRHGLAEGRLPSLRRNQGLILSSAEVASLYHFPPSRISKTDNLITSLSKTLPAPIALKQQIAYDVVLGENLHNGTKTIIGLTEQERERHLYIIGGTGNGKTTLLQYGIVQDMKNGKGLAIVDPHGDMAETILHHVPPERINDVIYFNPDDLEYPIGLNLLELTPGLSGNELLREKDIITESVISVFRKIFSEEDTGGHRIEYILRNTIQTALTIENATLFTVFDLLNDTKYRRSITKSLEDKNLRNFWLNELGKAGDMQKVKMAAGITAKIGRFLFSASARQILEQPKSTIDFDDMINSSKILICNFSKGLIGEDTSELFGITVLAKLQLASLRRARITQNERRPFHIYVDEFQNFATQSFVQMLSESRKYKVFMTMAEQSTSQQKDQQMVNIILANVGTVICFRTGNPRDEQLLLPMFAPYVEQGEINNLPAFNFYARLSAIRPQEPLSGQTLLLENVGSKHVASQVIKLSQDTFATKKTSSETDSETPMTHKENGASKPLLDQKNAPQAIELIDA